MVCNTEGSINKIAIKQFNSNGNHYQLQEKFLPNFYCEWEGEGTRWDGMAIMVFQTANGVLLDKGNVLSLDLFTFSYF